MAQRRSGANEATTRVWTLAVTLAVALQTVAAGQQPTSESVPQQRGEPVPLWRQGISTWDGQRYRTPPATPAAADARQPAYHVPVEPVARVASVPGAVEPTRSRPAPARDREIIPLPQPAEPSVLGGSDLPMLGDPRGELQPEQLPAAVGEASSELPAPSITEQLETPAAVAEQPPLKEDVIRWYQYPWRWITEGWDNHAEFGLDGSDGNADTIAIQTGLELNRKTDIYSLAIDLDYRQASNRRQTTEDNGRFNIDYDRFVGESPWSMFGKLGLEWDEFKAFDLRLNLNGGLGYHWIRTPRTTFVTRFGAGTSREFGAPVERWVPEAVFGLDATHQLTKRQKLKGKVDYFPAWDDFSDFRLVSDVAWEILLDGSDNLSLKVAVTDRYDSTPQGAEPNDIYYSLLLLYKF